METGASEARMRKWRRRRKRKRKLQKLLQHSFPNGIALRQSSSWFPRLKQWKLHIARAEAEATAKSLSRGFLVSQGWKWSLGGSGVDRDDDEELQSEVIWGKNWFNFLLELLDEFVKSLRFQRLQPAQLGLKQVDVNIFSQEPACCWNQVLVLLSSSCLEDRLLSQGSVCELRPENLVVNPSVMLLTKSWNSWHVEVFFAAGG